MEHKPEGLYLKRTKKLKNAIYSGQKLGKMGPKKCQTSNILCIPHEVIDKTHK